MEGQGTPAARIGSGAAAPHSHPGHKASGKRRGMKRSSSAPNCNRGSNVPIKIGVCAMEKKATSKPMREITGRLTQGGEFELIIFGDKVILEEPIEKWPLCDVLLSWHSDGFPLRKAQAYAALRRPFMVNDVGMQDNLLDRRRVYKLLQESSIPMPTHIVVSRDRLPPGEADPPGFVEGEDYVELGGTRIDKPFVEKPVSGEDHNIYIYYPHSMGGGVKRLFRKVENKSADYDPTHPGTVRREGSFIYEQFLTTGGTDVKVYTVGPRYAHAEARKSPVVDGKVNRDAEGKEVRFPVLLSPQEKEIARMVCAAFGQRVCGFDLLRSESGKSYVCDVNGWSFVKNSKKYYDDAADVLRTMILSQIAPHRLAAAPEPMRSLRLPEECGHAPEEGCDCAEAAAAAEQGAAIMKEVASLQDMASLGGDDDGALDDDDSSSTNFGDASGGGAGGAGRFLELRCVLAVVRHGDRTPKQKMKMPVTQPAMLELFEKHKDSKGKQAKLKSPAQLQELLDVTRQLLADMERQQRAARSGDGSAAGEEERDQLEEAREKLRIVRTVLEQGGQFSGINRKVQLKPTKWGPPAPLPAPGTGAASGGGAGGGGAAAAAAGGKEGEKEAGADKAKKAEKAEAPAKGDKGEDAGQEKERESGAGGGAGGGGGEGGGVAAQPSVGAPVVKELLLILKWGGVLTHAGRKQAEDLGKSFRMLMYPRYGPGGGGLLRLHSTYRHDLKIYSSDEGRVQMSAAAFTKGLLDLEGSSLTPILVSLVKKDASMLDAFGKGASEDILSAKNALYQHLTWDPAKNVSLCPKLAPPLATPLALSPPPSPRTTADGCVSPQPFSAGAPAAAAAARRSSTGGAHMRPSTSASALSDGSGGGAAAGAGVGGAGSNGGGASGPVQELKQSNSAGVRDSLRGAGEAGGASLHQMATVAAAMLAGGGAAPPPDAAAEARAAAVAAIPSMPERPLELLRRLVELMRVLVDLLREKCIEERGDAAAAAAPPSGSSPPGSAANGAAAGAATGGGGGSSSQAPEEWSLDAGRPCGGERPLLMFDRWRKLLRSFYSDKKGTFDISKIPDIYDSAKYDAIHNGHLALAPLQELYATSRALAAVVVPHEYGLGPEQKLRIGTKIAADLVSKIMVDLQSMQEESTVTAAMERDMAAARGSGGGKSGRRSAAHDYGDDAFDSEFGKMSVEDSRMRPFGSRPLPAVTAAGRRRGRSKPRPGGGSGSGAAPPAAPSAGAGADGGAPRRRSAPGDDAAGGGAAAAADGGAAGEGEGCEEGDDGEEEKETLHRLCPVYASDVNSPLRHVRTRIYFTSESHIHSLVNTLRYCHMHPRTAAAATAAGAAGAAPAAAGAAAGGGAFAGSGAQSWAQRRGSGSGSGSVPPPRSQQQQQPPQGDGAFSFTPNGWEAGDGAAVAAAGGCSTEPLISPEGAALLDGTDECDYLTHIVFKMFENKQVPLDSPERFVVEILFSNGANHDPTKVVPLANDHTLPVVPRAPLHTGLGVPLQRLDALLGPCAAPRKAAPCSYALQVALCAPLSSQASSAAPSRAMSGMIQGGSAFGSGSALSTSGLGGSGSNLAGLAGTSPPQSGGGAAAAATAAAASAEGPAATAAAAAAGACGGGAAGLESADTAAAIPMGLFAPAPL